jgi:putative serine protease PepD
VRALDLPVTRALEIISREAGGPAAQSDLHPGDLVVGVNDEPVNGIDALYRTLSRAAMDAPLTLKVVRRMEVLSIPITPREGFTSQATE